MTNRQEKLNKIAKLKRWIKLSMYILGHQLNKPFKRIRS